jgi:hypothetical protein
MTDNLPPDAEAAFVRFAALVRRELGAEDVRLANDEPEAPAPNVLYTKLDDGSSLVVTFAEPPENPSALARRLDILVGTFSQVASAPEHPASMRFSVARSLRDELRALANRAQAVEALVLDAHSPVVWGAASQRGPLEEPSEPIAAVLHIVDPFESASSIEKVVGPPQDPVQDVDPSSPALSPIAPASTHSLRDSQAEVHDLAESALRALREVRGLPGVDALRRGKPLHETVREPDFGYVAQSFAAIYILVLVFEAPFDELRAERAQMESLPRIERLVLALPPLDPTPEPRANVVSMRRRRR